MRDNIVKKSGDRINVEGGEDDDKEEGAGDDRDGDSGVRDGVRERVGVEGREGREGGGGDDSGEKGLRSSVEETLFFPFAIIDRVSGAIPSYRSILSALSGVTCLSTGTHTVQPLAQSASGFLRVTQLYSRTPPAALGIDFT